MQKHSVNLIIKKENESPFFIKLKTYLPIVSLMSLFLFVVFFLGSLIYINKNGQDFNALEIQTDNLQRKIANNKNVEGIYTLSILRLKTIDKLSSTDKNFSPLLSEILKLSNAGLTISQVAVDEKNSVTASVTASSAASLDDFITSLLQRESKKLFSQIKSSGIVRDKGGNYLLSITLNPSSTLLQ